MSPFECFHSLADWPHRQFNVFQQYFGKMSNSDYRNVSRCEWHFNAISNENRWRWSKEMCRVRHYHQTCLLCGSSFVFATRTFWFNLVPVSCYFIKISDAQSIKISYFLTTKFNAACHICCNFQFLLPARVNTFAITCIYCLLHFRFGKIAIVVLLGNVVDLADLRTKR